TLLAAGTLGNPGASWHAIGTSDFNGDGKADILWQNTDGLTGTWEMNGFSIIASGTFTNPGSTWKAQADGPIDQTDSASQPPTLHLSSPDATNSAMWLSSPDTTNAGLHLSMPDAANGSAAGLPHGLTGVAGGVHSSPPSRASPPFDLSSPPSWLPPQLAATWSSAVNSPAAQTVWNHLFPGTG